MALSGQSFFAFAAPPVPPERQTPSARGTGSSNPLLSGGDPPRNPAAAGKARDLRRLARPLASRDRGNEGVRLQQYEPVFRNNDIDSAVLPSLTAEDLKDLGITSIGHRRRLL